MSYTAFTEDGLVDFSWERRDAGNADHGCRDVDIDTPPWPPLVWDETNPLHAAILATRKEK